jgi:hypothetical protein
MENLMGKSIEVLIAFLVVRQVLLGGSIHVK